MRYLLPCPAASKFLPPLLVPSPLYLLLLTTLIVMRPGHGSQHCCGSAEGGKGGAGGSGGGRGRCGTGNSGCGGGGSERDDRSGRRRHGSAGGGGGTVCAQLLGVLGVWSTRPREGGLGRDWSVDEANGAAGHRRPPPAVVAHDQDGLREHSDAGAGVRAPEGVLRHRRVCGFPQAQDHQSGTPALQTATHRPPPLPRSSHPSLPLVEIPPARSLSFTPMSRMSNGRLPSLSTRRFRASRAPSSFKRCVAWEFSCRGSSLAGAPRAHRCQPRARARWTLLTDALSARHGGTPPTATIFRGWRQASLAPMQRVRQIGKRGCLHNRAACATSCCANGSRTTHQSGSQSRTAARW